MNVLGELPLLEGLSVQVTHGAILAPMLIKYSLALVSVICSALMGLKGLDGKARETAHGRVLLAPFRFWLLVALLQLLIQYAFPIALVDRGKLKGLENQVLVTTTLACFYPSIAALALKSQSLRVSESGILRGQMWAIMILMVAAMTFRRIHRLSKEFEADRRQSVYALVCNILHLLMVLGAEISSRKWQQTVQQMKMTTYNVMAWTQLVVGGRVSWFMYSGANTETKALISCRMIALMIVQMLLTAIDIFSKDDQAATALLASAESAAGTAILEKVVVDKRQD
jgi:hypothetical protein